MIAHKVINVVEGVDEKSSNLIIYPTHNEPTFIARAFYSDFVTVPLEINNKLVTHCHYDKWWMEVNIDEFKSSSSSSVFAKEAVGAHELGHIIGIFDVDECCSSSNLTDHHQEILMGYGDILSDRSTYIKYKDIAGVAITRGFHDDDDHVWMLRTNSDGTKDVICAQCNGVRYNITLTDGKYEGKNVNPYQSCIHHGGTNQKMLLVATDGDRYFYKCQYCRYIATFDEANVRNVSSDGANADITLTLDADSDIYYRVIVYDTYTYNLKSTNNNADISLYDSNMNLLDVDLSDASTSDGVDISLLDDSTYYLRITNNTTTAKNVTVSLYGPHIHSFDYWAYLNDTTHIRECGCGARGTTTAKHVFSFPDELTGEMNCRGCGYTKYNDRDGGNIILGITKVSVNGSYLLPDGTVILVDEDVEAYLAGTLVFYDKDKLPVTQ